MAGGGRSVKLQKSRAVDYPLELSMAHPPPKDASFALFRRVFQNPALTEAAMGFLLNPLP
jgi:hypothetical protein